MQFRQTQQRMFQAFAQFVLREQGFRGVLVPGKRGDRPVTVIRAETLIADRAVGRGQIIEQHFATILFVAALGSIGGDGQQPGLEAGAPFELGQVAYHRQPGVLYHFVGMTLTGNRVGHRAHGALVLADQFLVGPLLALEQAFKQVRVVRYCHSRPRFPSENAIGVGAGLPAPTFDRGEPQDQRLRRITLPIE